MTEVFNEEKKGLSIAALVVGIIGIATSCLPIVVGVVCGILAIIFGAICLVKKIGIKGMAITGLVLGIVATALNLIGVFCLGGLLVALGLFA